MLSSALSAAENRTNDAERAAARPVMRILLIAPQPFFAQRGTLINVRQMAQTVREAAHEAHLAQYPMAESVSPARLRGIPVIYDMDSSLSDQLSYGGRIKSRALLGLLRRMERAALRRCKLAITVSASLTVIASLHRRSAARSM